MTMVKWLVLFIIIIVMVIYLRDRYDCYKLMKRIDPKNDDLDGAYRIRWWARKEVFKDKVNAKLYRLRKFGIYLWWR